MRTLSTASRFCQGTVAIRVAVVLITFWPWGGASGLVIQTSPAGSNVVGSVSGAFGRWGDNATAIAVAPNWAITTRHQDDLDAPVDRPVVFAGQTYTALAGSDLPGDVYTPGPGVDLRLVRVVDAEGRNAALPTYLGVSNRGVPQLTDPVLVGGYGGGAGETSGVGVARQGLPGNQNPLRFGLNRIPVLEPLDTPIAELAATPLLTTGFEMPGDTSWVPFETIAGPGDSGGAWLVNIGQALVISGLIHGVATGEPGATITPASEIALTDLATYGDRFYAVDVTAYAAAIQAFLAAAAVFPGDFDGNGFVSQGDLDLVLLNWGDNHTPAGWMPEGFDGAISQNELDAVLLNWGDGTPPALGVVPEPGTLSLCLVGVGLSVRRTAWRSTRGTPRS